MILDYHKDFMGLCIEFKSPTGKYHVSDAQKEMKTQYIKNGYAFILSNNYDKICKAVHGYTYVWYWIALLALWQAITDEPNTGNAL